MGKQKLLGIELFRGLSAYAVILVHSGDETWGVPINDSAILFRQNFYFAVSFFLITAFYFMTQKPDVGYSTRFWESKIERILIPYLIWSMIFLVFRIVFFTITQKHDRIQMLLGDPLSLIFFGGASYHLYFLPLLLTGSCLLLLYPLLERLKAKTFYLLIFSILSVLLYNLIEVSGNSFQLGPNVAFQSLLASMSIDVRVVNPLLRWLLVESAWLIRCLPYFLLTLTLHKLFPNLRNLYYHHSIFVLACLFIFANFFGRTFLPIAIQEIAIACSLLLFSISISTFFKSELITKIFISLGMCSFGIYFIHPIVMNVIKPLLSKIFPTSIDMISIPSMLSISLPCFLTSWLLTVFLKKNKLASKYLFGM
jgi:peptidoglycan/LPS O-acetylase OafA/YrhL